MIKTLVRSIKQEKEKFRMSAKEELVEIALRTKDDILILDPESEVRHEVA